MKEIKGDTKNSSYEATERMYVSNGTYFKCASTVSSYVSIFETLWRQSGLYGYSTPIMIGRKQLSDVKEHLERDEGN